MRPCPPAVGLVCCWPWVPLCNTLASSLWWAVVLLAPPSSVVIPAPVAPGLCAVVRRFLAAPHPLLFGPGLVWLGPQMPLALAVWWAVMLLPAPHSFLFLLPALCGSRPGCPALLRCGGLFPQRPPPPPLASSLVWCRPRVFLASALWWAVFLLPPLPLLSALFLRPSVAPARVPWALAAWWVFSLLHTPTPLSGFGLV